MDKNIARLNLIFHKSIKDFRPKNEVDTRIRDTLKRIANEYRFCLNYKKGNEYFPLQQIRLLLEKIINVMNLQRYGKDYYNYLEYVTMASTIRNNWSFLKGQPDPVHMKNMRLFYERHQLRSVIQDQHLYSNKFYQFEYDLLPVRLDSNLVIHDDNATYQIKIQREKLTIIKSITLFFVCNIFIPYVQKKGSIEFLKDVQRENKNKMIRSGLIKRKAANELKEELRDAN